MVCEDRTDCPNQGSFKRKEGASDDARTAGVNKPGLFGNRLSGHPWDGKSDLGDPACTPNPPLPLHLASGKSILYLSCSTLI